MWFFLRSVRVKDFGFGWRSALALRFEGHALGGFSR